MKKFFVALILCALMMLSAGRQASAEITNVFLKRVAKIIPEITKEIEDLIEYAGHPVFQEVLVAEIERNFQDSKLVIEYIDSPEVQEAFIQGLKGATKDAINTTTQALKEDTSSIKLASAVMFGRWDEKIVEKMPEAAKEEIKKFKRSLDFVDDPVAAFRNLRFSKDVKPWMEYYYDELKSAQNMLNNEQTVFDTVSDYWNAVLSGEVEPAALPNIDKEMFDFYTADALSAAIGSGTRLKVDSKDRDAYGYLKSTENEIALTSLGLKRSRGLNQSTAEHETTHLKDYAALSKAGWTPWMLSGSYMDPTSYFIWNGILEARANAQQIIFIYQRAKLQGGEYEEDYKWLLENKEFSKVFDDAMKGKDFNDPQAIEEARHLVEIALLDSSYFAEGYIRSNIKFAKNSESLFSISIDEILAALGDGWLTKEDLYSAPHFWANVCKYEQTKDSEECQRALPQIKTYCKDQLAEKWGNCEKLGRVWCCDDHCSNKIIGKFLFTKSEDWDLGRTCCNWDQGEEGTCGLHKWWE